MTRPEDPRGILYPTRLPTFHRIPAPPELEDLIRWFWIPRWHLAPGRTSRQELLPFPASNLVVQPDGVTLSGPSTRSSFRDLRGTGWAVGALLRPAAAVQLHPDPGAVRDAEVPFTAPELHAAVVAAMGHDGGASSRTRAASAFARWAAGRLAAPDRPGRLANAMKEAIATDRGIVRVEHVAERLGTSTRGVQRLARSHVGLPPLAIIRRYRLQEAAARLREDASVVIADVAAELGYADQAHLSRDFRTVLGLTPRDYRGDQSPNGQ
ncbi:helix-turn-helix domain-containing protein [Citricoccus sp. I39-566]|uniref:AraC family transcriptional regulator n=1 Tax=Citricoccus sp. I39-566 TaxID=3073268 RepID=UPI00286C3A83|nr:helix-turn-helix domain-containing protein [Citricoccus sp. I39-566]WMY78806.1 helix-turn-helix domain-containing protein [Citricoccus sp. I39-566]